MRLSINKYHEVIENDSDSFIQLVSNANVLANVLCGLMAMLLLVLPQTTYSSPNELSLPEYPEWTSPHLPQLSVFHLLPVYFIQTTKLRISSLIAKFIFRSSCPGIH